MQLTPPRDRSIPPLQPPTTPPVARRDTSSRLGWLTATIFATLLTAAGAVFLLLPRWVEERSQTTTLPDLQQAEVDTKEPAPAAATRAPLPQLPVDEQATAATVAEPQERSRPAVPSPPSPAPSSPTASSLAASLSAPPQPSPSPPADNGYVAAMSTGLAALRRADHAAAREAFLQASRLRPEAPQSREGLAQAEEGLRLTALARHRDQGLAFEDREDWHAAVAEYTAALAIDPAVAFAQAGLERSQPRADLSDRLDFHIAHPERLSADDVLLEGSTLLDRARQTVSTPGPRLASQIARFEEIVRRASTLRQAVLESDNLTEVVVYKVGRLGTFHRHTLDLRPGVYTVVGSRRGYRDVRRQLVISADAEPEPLLVRCEEKI